MTPLGFAFERISTAFKSRRASPSAKPTRRARALSSRLIPVLESNFKRSSSARLSNTYTVARDSSAELTSNEGFSVVAVGRADEGEEAALDERQEGVLLRLVEAVHFVHEQDGATPAGCERLLCGMHCVPNILDAREHRGERDEFRLESLRHQARKGRLARARRPPQDHGVRLARLEGHAQRLARTEKMLLAYNIIQRPRPEFLRERCYRQNRAEQVIPQEYRLPWAG